MLKGSQHHVQIAVMVEICHIAGPQAMFSQRGAVRLLKTFCTSPKDVRTQVWVGLGYVTNMPGIHGEQVNKSIGVEIRGRCRLAAVDGNLPDSFKPKSIWPSPVD